MIVLLLMFFSGVILFEAPGLVKKKMWRELAAFSGFLLVGMVLSFLQTLGISFFNPSGFIEKVFKPVAELLK